MLMCVVAQVTAYATIRAELPAGCHRTVYICDDGKDPGEDSTVFPMFLRSVCMQAWSHASSAHLPALLRCSAQNLQAH